MKNNLVEDLLLLARGEFGRVLPDYRISKVVQVIQYHLPHLGVTVATAEQHQGLIKALLRAARDTFRTPKEADREYDSMAIPLTDYVQRMFYQLQYWVPLNREQVRAYEMARDNPDRPFRHTQGARRRLPRLHRHREAA